LTRSESPAIAPGSLLLRPSVRSRTRACPLDRSIGLRPPREIPGTVLAL
jgi:hypothetical protein